MQRTTSKYRVLIWALVLGIAISGIANAAATNWRPGLNFSDPGKVFPGYVVYTGLDGVIYVVDVDGQLVYNFSAPQGWTYGYARPIANGNILARITEDATGERAIIEINQSGQRVWMFRQPPGYTFHHDQSRLENGNTLILCVKTLLVPEISPEEILDDCVIEVTPDRNIVWEWQAADHYDDFNFSDQWKDAIAEHAGDWAHANAASEISSNTSHTDPRFRPGNIIVSFRFINSIVIIDRDTGAIVWRTDGLTIGQHDSHMLTDDQVGGGNILAFDNGVGGHYNFGGTETWSSHSRVVEIDPNDMSTPYIYDAKASGQPQHYFNSFFISSAQRLPNGNTLIDEGAFGRIFEVTQEGENVWEFMSPLTGFFQDQPSSRVYRAEKAPLEWLQP